MNSYQKKNIIYSIILLVTVGGVWLYRNAQTPESEEVQDVVAFRGQTMGTVYTVKYQDGEQRNFKSAIDSLLEVFNLSLNHYLPNSEISQFNQEDTFYFELPYFQAVLEKTQKIYEKTDGAFDPTVAPLVNAWGFGPDTTKVPTQAKVDSLMQYIGFDKIHFNNKYVAKTEPGVALNFSAIAKGYGVDVVGEYLQKQGIQNFMVEIGGEVVTRGNNPQGNLWRIGINNPDHPGELTSAISLENQAIATSGNYLNFYIKDGKRYAHTISPFTGFPVEHTVLSASVIAKDCATADAYATAFMVLGLEKAQKIAENNQDIEIYIIYDEGGEDKVYMSDSLKKRVLDI